MREGLIALLAAYDDLEMAGQVSNGRDALASYERYKPDVVLLDMVMPDMDGAQTTAALIKAHPDAKILILTSYKDDDLVTAAMKAGAMGYVLKSVSADELADAIRRTHAGKRALSPEATDALIHAAQRERDNALPEPLTEREKQVLVLMKEGLNNTQIAERLYLSVSTVKFHVSAILGKIGAVSRTEAVAVAIERKLI